SGGMGEVYLAEHRLLKRPNTVEVFDFGHTEDGTFYSVMEHLDGRSLDVVVEGQGPLPPGRVVHLLRQLCGALHEAHEQRLVHRDIKPANVLLSGPAKPQAAEGGPACGL